MVCVMTSNAGGFPGLYQREIIAITGYQLCARQLLRFEGLDDSVYRPKPEGPRIHAQG
jgi:hypothetical protein